MSGKEREYLKRLQRRADHLASRLTTNPDKFVHWDQAELNALQWAIEFIGGALGEDRQEADQKNLAGQPSKNPRKG